MQGARRGGGGKREERGRMKGVVHNHILRYSRCTHLPMFLACVHHLVIVVVLHVVEEDLLVPGMEI